MKRKNKGLACLAGGLLLTTMAVPMAGQTDTRHATDTPWRAPTAHAAQRPKLPEREYISHADARRLQEIIRRERQRSGHLLPQPGMTGPMLNARQPLRATANNQWVNIGPFNADYARYGDVVLNVIDAGDVADFATDPLDPNVLYAAFEQGGLWKSLDGGNSWRPKIEHLANLSAAAIAIDPTDTRKVYLGQNNVTGSAAVIRSLDGGETWSPAPSLEGAKLISQVMLLPAQPGVVLVATDVGLFRSLDSGMSYSKVSIVPPASTTRDAASIVWAGGSTLVVSFAPTQFSEVGQIWRSVDGGSNWNKVSLPDSAPISRITLASSPSSPSIL